MNIGEIQESQPVLEQAVDLVRALPDLITLTMALGQLATAYNFLNEPAKAKQAAEECLDSASEAGPTWAIALGLDMLAWAEGKLGHPARLSKLLAELEKIEVSPGNPMLMLTQMILGLEARAFGDLDHDRLLLERSLGSSEHAPKNI